jgi:hypothetical protein
MAARARGVAPAAPAPPDRNKLMEQKSTDTKLKEFIGFLARSDAKHDFHGTGFLANDDTAVNMNKGLMNASNKNFTDEQGSLWNVLIDLGGRTEMEKKGAIDDFLTNPPDGVFNVGFKDSAELGTGLHSYKVAFLNLEDGLKGEAFRVACNLHQGAALIVDFNQHGFLDKLDGKEDLKREHKPIYVITNSELINDAAPKTKYNDPTLFKEATALVSLVDLNPESKIYSSWDNTNIDYRNLFLTTYNYELSKIFQVKNIFGKTEKLTTNLTVSNARDKSTQLVVKDTKINNGKTEIWKKIQSLFVDFASNTFQVNQGFQRKRSGDWCQAISCFYLNNKTYYSKDLDSVYPNLVFEKKSIFFVTHDYIAASFALLIGVNVIFLTVSTGRRPSRVYFFKNERNEVTNYNDLYRVIRNEYDTGSLKNFITSYHDKRKSFLDTNYNLLMNDGDGTIKKLENYLNSAGNKTPEELKKHCLNIFENLYVYHQVKQSTPDVTELLTILNDRSILDVNEERWIETKKDYMKKQYEIICNARSIQTKYSTETILEQQINAIKQTQLFLTIKHWTYTKEFKLDGFYSRLGVGIGGGSLPTQDKFAFLPYFQTCDPPIKSRVSKVFQLLNKTIDTQESGQLQFFEGRKTGTTYQHTILSFKILASSVGIFLNDRFENKDQDNFNALKDKQTGKYGSNNLLSLSKVIEEHQSVKRRASTDPDKEDESRLAQDPYEEEPIEQMGGVYQTSGARTLIDNSVSETTDVLLTSHLILHSAAPVVEAVNANRNFRAQLYNANGGASVYKNTIKKNKIINKYPSYLPLYIVLEGLGRCIDELKNSPDYINYVKYYLLIESMYKALKDNSSDIIGLGLRETLITFITTEIGRKKIRFLFKTEDQFFNNFIYLTSSLGYSICGTFVDYDKNVSDVIDNAMKIVGSPIFESYMNNVMSIFKVSQGRIKEFYMQDMEFNLSYFAKLVNALQTVIANKINYANKPISYTIRNAIPSSSISSSSFSPFSKSTPASLYSGRPASSVYSNPMSPYSKQSSYSRHNTLRNLRGTMQTVGGRRRKTRKHKK